jgi:hypothetical protein
MEKTLNFKKQVTKNERPTKVLLQVGYENIFSNSVSP